MPVVCPRRKILTSTAPISVLPSPMAPVSPKPRPFRPSFPPATTPSTAIEGTIRRRSRRTPGKLRHHIPGRKNSRKTQAPHPGGTTSRENSGTTSRHHIPPGKTPRRKTQAPHPGRKTPRRKTQAPHPGKTPRRKTQAPHPGTTSGRHHIRENSGTTSGAHHIRGTTSADQLSRFQNTRSFSSHSMSNLIRLPPDTANDRVAMP
jgi:hypothetical protein